MISDCLTFLTWGEPSASPSSRDRPAVPPPRTVAGSERTWLPPGWQLSPCWPPSHHPNSFGDCSPENTKFVDKLFDSFTEQFLKNCIFVLLMMIWLYDLPLKVWCVNDWKKIEEIEQIKANWSESLFLVFFQLFFGPCPIHGG